MSYLEMIGLGIMQGLTEFLPISSTSHLRMIQRIFDIPQHEGVDLLLHTGTAMALALAMKRQIRWVIRIRRSWMVWLALATLPLVFLAPKFEGLKGEYDFGGYAYPIGMILTGFFLYTANRVKRGETGRADLDVSDPILMGFAQVTAFFPGFSRLGMTAGSGLWGGLDQKIAVDFAFLMLFPLVIGKWILAFNEPGFWLLPAEQGVPPQGIPIGPALTGVFVSFVVGLVVARPFIDWLRTASWNGLAFYLFLLGSILLSISYFG